MTDVNFANLPALKGLLKRAAIDAYMKQGKWGWVVTDGHYEIPGSSEHTITRPGEDGQGGGDWSGNFIEEWFVGGDKDREWKGHMDEVRTRIDNALRPWEDLPDPATFDSYVEELRQANGKLAVATGTSGGVATGAGRIGAQLGIIAQNSSAMSGGIITAFKSKFLGELGKAIGGHHGLTVILGQAMTAEQNLLKQARQDVAQAVASATSALDAYAKGGDPEMSFDFKVAGAVVAGVTAFATGGATVALAGAAAGLTLLTTLAEDSEKKSKEPASKDYEGLMKGFEDALGGINKVIKNEEGGVRDNLQTNLSKVQIDEASYHLTNPMQNISDDSELNTDGSRAIIHDRSLVFEITDTAMPTIADELVAAKDLVWTGWSATPYYRDSGIGLSETGPYAYWGDLAGVLWRLIGDLEWEVRNGAVTLKLAIEDMGQVDTDAKDALEKHAESIKGYTNYHVPK
jgi:hypothetical protein